MIVALSCEGAEEPSFKNSCLASAIYHVLHAIKNILGERECFLCIVVLRERSCSYMSRNMHALSFSLFSHFEVKFLSSAFVFACACADEDDVSLPQNLVRESERKREVF